MVLKGSRVMVVLGFDDVWVEVSVRGVCISGVWGDCVLRTDSWKSLVRVVMAGGGLCEVRVWRIIGCGRVVGLWVDCRGRMVWVVVGGIWIGCVCGGKGALWCVVLCDWWGGCGC